MLNPDIEALKAAAEHDPATVDQGNILVELAEENLHPRDTVAELKARIAELEKQVKDQQGELESRGAILNLAVTSARAHGFKQNGWIDSIDYLTKLALWLKETRFALSEAIIEGLQPGEEFGAVKRLVDRRNIEARQLVDQVKRRKEAEKERDDLLGTIKPLVEFYRAIKQRFVRGAPARFYWDTSVQIHPTDKSVRHFITEADIAKVAEIYAKYAPKGQGDGTV